jgi:hypothetical protein
VVCVCVCLCAACVCMCVCLCDIGRLGAPEVTKLSLQNPEPSGTAVEASPGGLDRR